MPELPEVETTRTSLLDKLESQKITDVRINHFKLRWPVPTDLKQVLVNKTIKRLQRRAKYLILDLNQGRILLHLGMSGHLKWVPEKADWEKHDHVGFKINNHWLRLNDPRRFGAVLYHEGSEMPSLLAHLGPEPLSKDFHSDWLLKNTQRRRSCIKTCIMDQKIVVGVGNIYASEALHLAGIHPSTQASQIDKRQCQRLVHAIQKVLTKAIEAGGTTLRDFKDGTGKRGYFAQKLQVYGRDSMLCYRCKTSIEKLVIQNRSSYFCPQCQPCDS